MRDARIVAVDPGLMTGVAVWEQDEAHPSSYQFSVDEFYAFIRDALLHNISHCVIVCEAYTISERTLKASRQAWSLEHIGALKWIAWQREHTFVLQQASAAKRFVDNAKLRTTGWYVPGRDHANDALRHMYLYCVQHKIISL